MGMPVIAGVDVEAARHKIKMAVPDDTPQRMLQQWGRMPWVEATESTLYAAIMKLMDPKARTYWGNRGLGHFNKHHAHTQVVPKLRAIYLEAMANA